MVALNQTVAVRGHGVLPANSPIATADDAGLVRGDGCFEATRVIRRDGTTRVEHLDEHLDRFAASSLSMGLPDLDVDAWRDLVDEAVSAWPGSGEAVLKLVRTRGLEHGGGSPTEFCTVTDWPDVLSSARDGISVVTLNRGLAADVFAEAPWLLGGVKTLSYAVNAAAKRHASALGADDALFVSSDGYALEGTTSALIVRNGMTLATTPTGPTGILPSITQHTVFDAALRDGLSVDHRLFTVDELYAADGLWLASSIRGVCPVLTLDGRPIANDPAWSSRVAGFAGF